MAPMHGPSGLAPQKAATWPSWPRRARWRSAGGLSAPGAALLCREPRSGFCVCHRYLFDAADLLPVRATSSLFSSTLKVPGPRSNACSPPYLHLYRCSAGASFSLLMKRNAACFAVLLGPLTHQPFPMPTAGVGTPHRSHPPPCPPPKSADAADAERSFADESKWRDALWRAAAAALRGGDAPNGGARAGRAGPRAPGLVPMARRRPSAAPHVFRSR